jgi:hypothetical protein
MKSDISVTVLLLVAVALRGANAAGHFPTYYYDIPGGFVQSMGNHKGVTYGYSFPG